VVKLLAKIVYYYNEKYYVREDWQRKEEGKPWGECPYPETATDAIDNLATSYTNALNHAHWIAEGEAKQAFLSASDIIVTFFASKDASKKSLFGDLSSMKGSWKELIKGSPLVLFDYLSEHVPDSLDGKFVSEVEAKEREAINTQTSQRFMETYHEVQKGKNSYKLYSTIKELIELKKGLTVEKQLAEKVKETGKADDNIRVKNLGEKLEKEIAKNNNRIDRLKEGVKDKGQEFISEYFAIWAPAVVTVMYEPKYRGIDWDKLIEEDPVRAKQLKKEIEERIIFEARCNIFAAKIMGWLSVLGIILLKSGVTCKNGLQKLICGLIGLLIIHSAQSISNGVKAAYGEYLKEEQENADISWQKIISLGLEVTKENLLDLKKYVGASKIYFTLPYQTKGYNPKNDINYIIAEKEIDAPRCLSRKLSHLVKNFFEYYSCRSSFKSSAG
jgi:hypothetical protein